MKLLFQSVMVFLGTLLAAALVALGETGAAEVEMASAQSAPSGQVVAQLLGAEH
jgi:hypothetical protein